MSDDSTDYKSKQSAHAEAIRTQAELVRHYGVSWSQASQILKQARTDDRLGALTKFPPAQTFTSGNAGPKVTTTETKLEPVRVAVGDIQQVQPIAGGVPLAPPGTKKLVYICEMVDGVLDAVPYYFLVETPPA